MIIMMSIIIIVVTIIELLNCVCLISLLRIVREEKRGENS